MSDDVFMRIILASHEHWKECERELGCRLNAAIDRECRLALAERSISIERVQAEQEATNLARELRAMKENNGH